MAAFAKSWRRECVPQEPLPRLARFLGGVLLAPVMSVPETARLGPRQGGGSRLATVMC
jgi:hypothetical protein